MVSTVRKSISYAIFFRLLEGLVFAPLLGLLGQTLRGRAVVDSTALVSYFLSPRGLAALAITGVSFLLIRMLEQAGLSLLWSQPGKMRPARVFRSVLTHIVPFIRAALRFLFLTLLTWLPFLALAGGISRYLLSSHDINFYLAERPPVFLGLGTVLAVVGLFTLGVFLWMMVRWRWVVHVILFERLQGVAAFRRSEKLVKGFWWSVAFRWCGIGLLNVGLGTLAAWVGRLMLPLGVALFGDSVRSLGALLGGLLIGQAIIGAVILMLAPITEAFVFTRIYFHRSGRSPSEAKDFPAGHSRQLPLLIPVGVFFVLIGLGGFIGSLMGTEALTLDRPVLVIAHRAGVGTVPENSIPAVEQAIQDGADVAEIDVQLSKDGEVVVIHDTDFSRLAGLPKRVADLTWAEIKKIDIGSRIAPQFSGTHVPRLEELLAVAKNRIRLNIELKHSGPMDNRLEDKVVTLLRQSGLIETTEIQSLEFVALGEIRRLEPRLKIGYLMSVNARRPHELEVDFLSVQASRIDGRFVRQARRARQKVYAWTVDERSDMERMIDTGVDGLITNQSLVAAQLLRERRNLNPRDVALRRIRAWLAT